MARNPYCEQCDELHRDCYCEPVQVDENLNSLAETVDGEGLELITPWQAMENERAELAAMWAWFRYRAERVAA